MKYSVSLAFLDNPTFCLYHESSCRSCFYICPAPSCKQPILLFPCLDFQLHLRKGAGTHPGTPTWAQGVSSRLVIFYP